MSIVERFTTLAAAGREFENIFQQVGGHAFLTQNERMGSLALIFSAPNFRQLPSVGPFVGDPRDARHQRSGFNFALGEVPCRPIVISRPTLLSVVRPP